MASGITRLTVFVLAFALFQVLYATSEKVDGENVNLVSAEGRDLRPELNNFDVDSETARQARQTSVVFRPLWATRERDAQRLESRRRVDEAKREREQKLEAKRRLAVAAAVAARRNYPAPAPSYTRG